MSTICTPCDRSFKTNEDLSRHIRDSFAHKPRTPSLAGVQNSFHARLLTVKAEQFVKPALTKPQRGLVNSRRSLGIAQGIHVQPQDANALISYTNPVMNPADELVKSPWSVIVESEYGAVFKALSAHCHTLEELKQNGYIVRPYSAQDYVNEAKCKRCNKQKNKASDLKCSFHPSKRNNHKPKKPYKCCSNEPKGCMTLPAHDFSLPRRALRHKDFLETPSASARAPKFRAVTLDCEMAGIASGEGEAILLCVTDYVTGAVLMNRFIWPNERITDMRTSIHGISKSTLDAAVLHGQALYGWEQSRLELWKYIDRSTILVGHALEHDLDALRIIHPLVVDSGILSRNAVGIHRIRWGLKTLCSELLNFEIRNNDGGIHDCLEDVLATREVVLFCTRNKEAFQGWANAKNKEEIRLQEEREIAKQKKYAKNYREKLIKMKEKTDGSTHSDSDGDREEYFYWSDLSESMGGPVRDDEYYF